LDFVVKNLLVVGSIGTMIYMRLGYSIYSTDHYGLWSEILGSGGDNAAIGRGFPLTAGAQQVEDAVGDSPEIHPRPSTLRTASIPGQQRLEPLPHLLRHVRKTTTPIAIHIRLHAKNK
jgi:hypothetical protein